MQFRRRSEKKTDYKQRLALLKSGKPRMVVRRSSAGFTVQIVEFQPEGDRTLVEIGSGALKKYGWKGHLGNMPSAYLCGLLAGKLAKKRAVEEAVPDLGMQASARGSVIYACLLGARDGGLRINIGKEALPRKERVEGRHIAAYAEMLKGGEKRKYSSQFSGYIRQGVEPEKLPEHFAEVKEKIMQEA